MLAQEEKAQEKKEKKKKKKIKDGVEDETKKGGIRWLPLFFVFMFTAPAVLPVVFSGIDMLGETSAGVAIHKWGMEVRRVNCAPVPGEKSAYNWTVKRPILYYTIPQRT